MSAESLTIIGTGIALAALTFTMLLAQRADMTRRLDSLRADMTKQLDDLRADVQALDDRVRNHGERMMAKLEGLLEGLREAISGRRAA